MFDPSEMTTKITSVSYSRLRSFGRFENERIEASAEVAEGQDPEQVLADLKEWVGSRLNKEVEIDRAEGRLLQIRQEIAANERDLQVARGRWEKAAAFLAKHGIDPTTFVEDISF